jgi:CheY-like chemotaxis protein
MTFAPQPQNIFLADDDADDCVLFEDALKEISDLSQLTTANDGIQLMSLLREENKPTPDVIFLDLNMPRKNGFECLTEIRETPTLKNVPIIIFSTTAQPEAVNIVYENGANCFVCKPNTFHQLKKAIAHVLSINWKEDIVPLSKEEFIFQP